MSMRDVLTEQPSLNRFLTTTASFQTVEGMKSQCVAKNQCFHPNAAAAAAAVVVVIVVVVDALRPPRHPPRCCCRNAQQMAKHSASVCDGAERDCQTARKLCCSGCKHKAFRGYGCGRVSSSALIS